MTGSDNRAALEKLRISLRDSEQQGNRRLVSLCAGSGCGAYGTAKVYKALMEELARQGMQDTLEVKLTGCHGF
jgi:NADH-quinone oxidoreductase subunit F